MSLLNLDELHRSGYSTNYGFYAARVGNEISVRSCGLHFGRSLL
jgi:hypothetical protein